MITFGERLIDLMEEHNIDAKTLAKDLGFRDSSIIYQWQKREKGILLSSAISIADYFKCSIDYLVGRETEYREVAYKVCPPFYIQLRAALAKNNVTQYRLLKDTNLSRGNLNSWFNNKSTPNIDSVIKLADYLNITIDELVGRE